MVINTKKLKRFTEKALKNSGVYVGMLENDNEEVGYCVNTLNFRIFVKEKYADNEFKSVLAYVMGCVPILGESGQFYYCKEKDEVMEQETLFAYQNFNIGAERAFVTSISVENDVAVIGYESQQIEAFNKEFVDIANPAKVKDSDEILKKYLKIVSNDTSVLIIKNAMVREVVLMLNKELSADINIVGALQTNAGRNKISGLTRDILKEFNYKVFENYIRASCKVPEANGMYKPLELHAPKANVTEDYRAFLREYKEITK